MTESTRPDVPQAEIKVYVVEYGEYEQRGIVGIYDTAERAMAAHPGDWTRRLWTSYPQWPKREPITHWQDWWRPDSYGIFVMNLTRHGGQVEPLAEATLQVLRDDGGGQWGYVTVTAAEADALMAGQ